MPRPASIPWSGRKKRQIGSSESESTSRFERFPQVATTVRFRPDSRDTDYALGMVPVGLLLDQSGQIALRTQRLPVPNQEEFLATRQ